MFFKLLKALGYDIPAQAERLRERVEERVSEATDRAKRVVVNAVIVAALGLFALITALAAIGVGLTALYRWVSDLEGPFVGYGVVGGLLLLVTIILVVTAWARTRTGQPSASAASASHVEHAAAAARAAAAAASQRAASAPPAGQERRALWTSSAIEVLGFALPLLLKRPSLASPLLNLLTGNARAKAAESGTREALERGANIVRGGNRTNMLAGLAGAVVLGWMLSRRYRR